MREAFPVEAGSELSQTGKILETKNLWEGSGADWPSLCGVLCVSYKAGGWRKLQQRAEYALGKLVRDQISQSFGPNSTGPWGRPWGNLSRDGLRSDLKVQTVTQRIHILPFFDLKWLRDEHTVLEALRHGGVESHWRAPHRCIEAESYLLGRCLLNFSTSQYKRVY